MPYITFATLLLIAISGIFAIYHQLQQVQKNSYSFSEYFKWLKEAYTTEFAISAVFYAAITLGVVKEKDILACVLAAVLAVLQVALNLNLGKKADKKLAFTARVKALYIAAILILGGLLIAYTFTQKTVTGSVIRTLYMLLSIVTPVLTMVVWGITAPIEKRLSKKTKKEFDADDGATD